MITLSALLMLASALLLWRARPAAGPVLRARLALLQAQARPAVAAAAAALPAEGRLALTAHRAQLPPRLLALGLAAAPLAAAAKGALVLGPAGLLLALPALGAALLALRWRIEGRRAALEAELPTFLDRLRQQLLVGASIPQALSRTVAASPPVLRRALEPAERRVAAGADLLDALEWAAERTGGAVLAPLVAAIAASLRFGGRLAEALAALSAMERARGRVRDEMRAATAEVRASAVILALLPLGVAAWLAWIAPDFTAYFLDPERGQGVLWVVGALYLSGLAMLRQIARPRF